MLQWVFGGKRKTKPQPAPDYERAKEISAKGGMRARRKLAAHEDLQPEFLYYFATDDAPEVRRTVAANPSTPLQADVILSKDKDDDVRVELGHKIGDLLPDLSDAQGEKVQDMVFQILETLAKDQIPRVRAVIAEEIKLLDNVPPRIAKMLAEDVESLVAAPILRYSPLLTNRDLRELLEKGLAGDALVALARRSNLDKTVADAVVDTDEVPAINALLENKSADIGETAMAKIVDIAEPRKDMHEPLVQRGGLSERMITRIAGFVSASLLDPLIKHNALVDEVMAEQLRESVAKRLETTGEQEEDQADDGDDDDKEFERAKSLHEKGELTAAVLMEAVKKNQRGFIIHALSFASELPTRSIEGVFEARSGKSAMAIAWQCELTAEFAVLLQRNIWKVPERDILRARSDGGYPMSEDDLEWSYDLLK